MAGLQNICDLYFIRGRRRWIHANILSICCRENRFFWINTYKLLGILTLMSSCFASKLAITICRFDALCLLNWVSSLKLWVCHLAFGFVSAACCSADSVNWEFLCFCLQPTAYSLINLTISLCFPFVLSAFQIWVCGVSVVKRRILRYILFQSYLLLHHQYWLLFII